MITSFQLIFLDNQKILTSSLDQFICIWSLKGQCEAKININHPLPLKWNVHLNDFKQISQSILHALNIIDSLCKLTLN